MLLAVSRWSADFSRLLTDRGKHKTARSAKSAVLQRIYVQLNALRDRAVGWIEDRSIENVGGQPDSTDE
jgi:hypothetical protein